MWEKLHGLDVSSSRPNGTEEDMQFARKRTLSLPKIQLMGCKRKRDIKTEQKGTSKCSFRLRFTIFRINKKIVHYVKLLKKKNPRQPHQEFFSVLDEVQNYI